MSKVDGRDKEIEAITSKLFDDAASQGDSELDTVTEWKLGGIVSSSSWGLREVLLTAVIAKLHNPSFDPTSRLYECNPRAIYEGPIRRVLVLKKIPHGKSGVLNVAKAAKGLDSTWAAQRRPKEAAIAVKEMAEHINTLDKTQLNKFGVRLAALLLKEKAKASTYVPPDLDVIQVAEKRARASIELIREAPDRGNTPQKICGMILDAHFKSIGADVVVDGLKDEACVTNTTSKKPADLCETMSNGEVLKAYEVSVKKIDENRISDSWQAIMDYNNATHSSISEVIYLCRPEDLPKEVAESLVSKEKIYLGELEKNGVLYRFISLFPWIHFMVTTVLNPEARDLFRANINEYISDVNTRPDVKTSWKKILDGMQ